MYAVTEFHPCIVRVERPEGLELGKGFSKFATKGVSWRDRKVKGAPWDTLIVSTYGSRKTPAIAAVITMGIVVDRAFMCNLFWVRSSGGNIHDRTRLERNLP